MARKPITGRCTCGNISYRIDSSPLPMSTVLCNCEDCQRSSGSAHAVVVPFRSATIHFLGEEPATFRTTGTDSGENRARRFCPKCGSPILSVLAEAPELSFVKAGTLDDKSLIHPHMEVWTASAQPWTKRLPKRPSIKRGPPTISLRATRPMMKLWNRLGRAA